MNAILTALLPVALKAIEWFLDKRKADKQTMQDFYKFVEKIGKEYLNSAKLQKHAQRQLEELKNKPFVET